MQSRFYDTHTLPRVRHINHTLMKPVYLVLFSLLSLLLPAQTILNAYAKVTSITGSNVLALSNVNITNHTFIVGERVVVMQMQDDVIGTNTTNNASFGDLSAINNAGKYEIMTISAITPTSGVPTSITLSTLLSNPYNTGVNSSVQLISFRNMGTNYVTTANITGLKWDGNVGGVIAFYAGNTLTLNHRVLADGLGFLGGAVSGSEDIACDNTIYITNSSLKGFKGEGIYKNTNANFTNARGKILSGGGGGSPNNAGGGGGGNYTSGGNGGLGWTCNAGNTGAGLGGISLSAHIGTGRIFMGGGGGGGQQNNNVGSSGGDGGGIILIQTTTFSTNTTCGSSIMVSANGVTAGDSGNDGAGGGGAGGGIVIQATSFSINSTCPLTVRANAGSGGNVGNSGSHGGGGGGGQGAVVYSSTQPVTNVVTQTNNGTGGVSDNASSGAAGASGSGSNGAGIIGSAGPLPIDLVEFKAEAQSSKVLLSWLTASETNNDYFTVEKSTNGLDYTAIAKVTGAGTSSSPNKYSTYDNSPLEGTTYYRLKQTDYNKACKYSPVVSLYFSTVVDFSFFPNPVKHEDLISIKLNKNSEPGEFSVRIYDFTGKEIYSQTVVTGSETTTEFSLKNLSLREGVYFLKLQSGASSQIKKLVIN